MIFFIGPLGVIWGVEHESGIRFCRKCPEPVEPDTEFFAENHNINFFVFCKSLVIRQPQIRQLGSKKTSNSVGAEFWKLVQYRETRALLSIQNLFFELFFVENLTDRADFCTEDVA